MKKLEEYTLEEIIKYGVGFKVSDYWYISSFNDNNNVYLYDSRHSNQNSNVWHGFLNYKEFTTTWIRPNYKQALEEHLHNKINLDIKDNSGGGKLLSRLNLIQV
jgi:hypothetical protein